MPGLDMTEGEVILFGGLPAGQRRDSKTPTLGSQSLLAAMNKFVHSVEEMQAAVMIPCKLQDMTPDMSAVTADNKSLHKSCSSSSLSNGLSDSSQQSSSCSQALVVKPPTDLYTYYSMLNAIKTELVQGPPQHENDVERNGDVDNIAEETAIAFRYHLRELFDVLRQMTTSAEILTTTYKQAVGDTSTSSHIAPQSRTYSHITL